METGMIWWFMGLGNPKPDMWEWSMSMLYHNGKAKRDTNFDNRPFIDGGMHLGPKYALYDTWTV